MPTASVVQPAAESRPGPAAVDDPVAALVYSARAADVVLTMVGGRTLYEAEVGFPFLDVSALRGKVRRVRRGLRDAAENERDAAALA